MRRWIPWVVATAIVAVLVVRDWRLHQRADQRFDAEIRQAARQHEVDPALVKAVIWRESSFDPDARGRAGEIGLMQIRELAAVDWCNAEGIRGFEVEHLADPGTNILAGTWYLGHLLRRYRHTDNPTPYALADYNAGRANVRKWIKFPGADTNSALFLQQVGFPATRRYILSVLKRYRQYLPPR